MKTSTVLYIALVLNFFSLPSSAGEISSYRGKKVVIQLDSGESVRLHQRLVIKDPDSGKRLGILEIVKKRGSKALGQIRRGFAKNGAITSPYKNATGFDEFASAEKNRGLDASAVGSDDDLSLERSSRAPASSSPEETDNTNLSNEDGLFDNSEAGPSRGGLWGFGVGIAPTEIRVSEGQFSNTLKGDNFVVRVAYDQPLQKNLSALLGINILPISGTQADDTLGTAKMDATYLSLEGNLRLSFFRTPSKGPWISGGFNYLRAQNRSSNVVDPSSIENRYTFQVGAGFNASMGSEFLMFRADLLMHSASSSVSISQQIFSAIYFFN